MAVRGLGGRFVPEPPPDRHVDRVVCKDFGGAFAVFVGNFSAAAAAEAAVASVVALAPALDRPC